MLFLYWPNNIEKTGIQSQLTRPIITELQYLFYALSTMMYYITIKCYIFVCQYTANVCSADGIFHNTNTKALI